jgi:hypothetical protein
MSWDKLKGLATMVPTLLANSEIIRQGLTTAQQLRLASPIIAKAFTNAYSTTVIPFASPHTRANAKWSKILINGLPTGVTDSRGTYTPDECYTALASENPSYTPLIIAQKPLWVKPSHSFTPGSSSSLVMAFKDLDGTIARVLLGAKHLYAFSTHATFRKWKQRPTQPIPPTPKSDDTKIVVAPSQLPTSFISSSSVPAESRPVTRPTAVLQPMATRSAKAKNKK